MSHCKSNAFWTNNSCIYGSRDPLGCFTWMCCPLVLSSESCTLTSEVFPMTSEAKPERLDGCWPPTLQMDEPPTPCRWMSPLSDHSRAPACPAASFLSAAQWSLQKWATSTHTVRGRDWISWPPAGVGVGTAFKLLGEGGRGCSAGSGGGQGGEIAASPAPWLSVSMGAASLQPVRDGRAVYRPFRCSTVSPYHFMSYKATQTIRWYDSWTCDSTTVTSARCFSVCGGELLQAPEAPRSVWGAKSASKLPKQTTKSRKTANFSQKISGINCQTVC